MGGSHPAAAPVHKPSQQQQGTPSLFFMGGSKHHSNRRSSASPSKLPSCSPSSKQSASIPTQQDIVQERDLSSSNDHDEVVSALLDLELQFCASGPEIDALIGRVPEKQLTGIQRLLCNPSILMASQQTFKALSQCQSLGFLILSLHPEDNDVSSLAWDEQRLASLLKSLPSLVCLDLSDCSISDKNLILIAQASCSPQLRALDLSYSPQLSMMGVNVLLASCPLLEELDLSACEKLQISDEAIKLIGQRCPLLSSLFVEASETNKAMGRLTMRSLTELVVNCKQLSVLFLTGLDLTFDPHEWGKFVANGSSLQSLGLSFEGSVFRDSDLENMTLGLSGLHLSSLSLRGCSLLTNDGVASVLLNLPELSELSLLNCPAIDAEILKEKVNHIKGEGFSLEVRSKQEERSEVAELDPAGSTAAAAPWSSLLSFLVTSASDLTISSAKKIRR